VSLEKDKVQETETRKQVAQEEAEAAKQQAEANILKSEAESMVEEAETLLAKTLDKVKNLTQANIVEVRSLGSPPAKVKLVAQGCGMLLLDNSKVPGILNKKTLDEYWDIARKHYLDNPGKLFIT
jgi:hypothetical protein